MVFHVGVLWRPYETDLLGQGPSLGPVVALRETSVIFGTVIGTFVLKEAFGLRRITASTFVIAGIAMLALVR